MNRNIKLKLKIRVKPAQERRPSFCFHRAAAKTIENRPIWHRLPRRLVHVVTFVVVRRIAYVRESPRRCLTDVVVLLVWI